MTAYALIEALPTTSSDPLRLQHPLIARFEVFAGRGQGGGSDCRYALRFLPYSSDVLTEPSIAPPFDLLPNELVFEVLLLVKNSGNWRGLAALCCQKRLAGLAESLWPTHSHRPSVARSIRSFEFEHDLHDGLNAFDESTALSLFSNLRYLRVTLDNRDNKAYPIEAYLIPTTLTDSLRCLPSLDKLVIRCHGTWTSEDSNFSFGKMSSLSDLDILAYDFGELVRLVRQAFFNLEADLDGRARRRVVLARHFLEQH
jgi:hypothetical protein